MRHDFLSCGRIVLLLLLIGRRPLDIACKDISHGHLFVSAPLGIGFAWNVGIVLKIELLSVRVDRYQRLRGFERGHVHIAPLRDQPGAKVHKTVIGAMCAHGGTRRPQVVSPCGVLIKTENLLPLQYLL